MLPGTQVLHVLTAFSMIQHQLDRTPNETTSVVECVPREGPTGDSHLDGKRVIDLMTLVGSMTRIARIGMP